MKRPKMTKEEGDAFRLKMIREGLVDELNHKWFYRKNNKPVLSSDIILPGSNVTLSMLKKQVGKDARNLQEKVIWSLLRRFRYDNHDIYYKMPEPNIFNSLGNSKLKNKKAASTTNA